MLLMLGNSEALVDMQLELDALTLEVAELQAEYDVIMVDRVDLEIKLNELYRAFKQNEQEEDYDNSYAMKQAIVHKTGELKNEWRTSYNDLKDLIKLQDTTAIELDLKTTLLELEEKKMESLLKVNANPERYNNISISLSKNCKTLIQYDLYTNCPTYRELFDTFDTTDPMVSGVMVEGKNDVVRVDIMKKHWKFYDATTFELIMVDPDADFQKKSINIEIQARDFKTVALHGSDKARGFHDNTYTVWENFKTSADCKQIIVAPRMNLIEQAVTFAKNACNGELDISQTITPVKQTDFNYYKDWKSSPALVYQNWLKNAIENNKELRLGLD
jgi:hypothetical protein